MYESLITFTESLPVWLQAFGVALISAIPLIESYNGSAIGVIAGVPGPLALLAAIVGNVVSMLVVVQFAHGTRTRITTKKRVRAEARTVVTIGADETRPDVGSEQFDPESDTRTPDAASAGDEDAKDTKKSHERIIRIFNRYGVAGVSLLGQTFLPSQITSGILVGLGASKNAVIGWQIVSIILWGTLFTVLASLGVLALAG